MLSVFPSSPVEKVIIATIFQSYVIVIEQDIYRYKHATSSGNLRAHLSNEHGIDAASKNRDIKQRKLSEMFGLKDKTTTEGSSGSQVSHS